MGEALDAMAPVLTPVRLRFPRRPRLRDPADEMVLETAVNGGADRLALRLQASLLDEARRVSNAEGVALNQLTNVAVAEKLSALRTEDYFRERAVRGDVQRAKRILKRAGKGNEAAPGDGIG